MNSNQRKANESQTEYRARIKAGAAAVKQQLKGTIVHVSKPLVLVPNAVTGVAQLAVTSAPGTTLHINGEKQRLRRMRRKDRVMSARQQRKWLKASHAEAKADAAINKSIADFEANADWAEEEADRNYVERQNHLDNQYEEHFA